MGTNVKTDGVNRVGVFMDARHTDAFDSLRVDSFTPMAGWTFAYNINPALITTETDGANGEVTHSGNHARLSTGAAASSYAQIQTRKASRYIPGVGGLVRFTAVFSEPTEGSQQLIGLFDDQNGWGFGYDGLKFGVFRRSLGVDYWAYQDDWNVETYDRLDPTKGNVYQIEYRWLGYGAQLFAIEDWETGAVDVVHRVDYANRYAVTSIDNPNLPLTARAENTTNETDMVLRTPSAIAGLDGDAYNDAVSTIIATDVQTVSIASDTEEAILTLRNPSTYKSKNNRLFVQALRLSFATDGTKDVVFRIYANATITGGTYNDLNTEVTPIQRNTTMTGFSNGVQIGTFILGKVESEIVDLTGSQFKGFPGEEITITAISDNSSDVSAGVTFRQFL